MCEILIPLTTGKTREAPQAKLEAVHLRAAANKKAGSI